MVSDTTPRPPGLKLILAEPIGSIQTSYHPQVENVAGVLLSSTNAERNDSSVVL